MTPIRRANDKKRNANCSPFAFDYLRFFLTKYLPLFLSSPQGIIPINDIHKVFRIQRPTNSCLRCRTKRRPVLMSTFATYGSYPFNLDVISEHPQTLSELPFNRSRSMACCKTNSSSSTLTRGGQEDREAVIFLHLVFHMLCPK